MAYLIIACRRILQRFKDDHVSAYAAQASYFILLSIFPCLMLLLLLVQYTPVTEQNVIQLILEVIPDAEEFEYIIKYIIDEIYEKSTMMLSFSAIVILWSSGKGIMAISNGLNCIYGIKETRNYLMTRIRSTIYTVLFILSIFLCMLAVIFGNHIQKFLVSRIPILETIANYIVGLRALVPVVVLMVVFLMVYTFLPNRKTTIRSQFPGAVISTIAWMLYSLVVSLYLNYEDLTYTYGSMTIAIFILLWLYFCMYIILLGAEINAYLEERKYKRKI